MSASDITGSSCSSWDRDEGAAPGGLLEAAPNALRKLKTTTAVLGEVDALAAGGLGWLSCRLLALMQVVATTTSMGWLGDHLQVLVLVGPGPPVHDPADTGDVDAVVPGDLRG
jgi:hypothetical protein